MLKYGRSAIKHIQSFWGIYSSFQIIELCYGLFLDLRIKTLSVNSWLEARTAYWSRPLIWLLMGLSLVILEDCFYRGSKAGSFVLQSAGAVLSRQGKATALFLLSPTIAKQEGDRCCLSKPRTYGVQIIIIMPAIYWRPNPIKVPLCFQNMFVVGGWEDGDSLLQYSIPGPNTALLILMPNEWGIPSSSCICNVYHKRARSDQGEQQQVC